MNPSTTEGAIIAVWLLQVWKSWLVKNHWVLGHPFFESSKIIVYTGTKPHFRTRLHCIPESCLLSTAVPKSLKRHIHTHTHTHAFPLTYRRNGKEIEKKSGLKGQKNLVRAWTLPNELKKLGVGVGNEAWVVDSDNGVIDFPWSAKQVTLCTAFLKDCFEDTLVIEC